MARVGRADEKASSEFESQGTQASGGCCLSHDLGYEAPNILRLLQDLGGAISPCAHPPRGLDLTTLTDTCML